MAIDEVLEFLHGKQADPLGELIRRHRRSLGFTQEELAEKVGVSQNYIAKIETGFCNSVSPKTLIKLAIALDIPTGELIELNLGVVEEVAELIDKRSDLDNSFRILPTKLKELLLKLAPILEKYT